MTLHRRKAPAERPPSRRAVEPQRPPPAMGVWEVRALAAAAAAEVRVSVATRETRLEAEDRARAGAPRRAPAGWWANRAPERAEVPLRLPAAARQKSATISNRMPLTRCREASGSSWVPTANTLTRRPLSRWIPARHSVVSKRFT